MCSDLWGKEARNNSAILRAWDELSQFRTMTVKTLEVVEFIEALESVDGMCAARAIPPTPSGRFLGTHSTRADRLAT